MIVDMVNKLGLMDNFSQRNRQIVRALVDTVDGAINVASRKPVVRSVMEGMDANMDMLLDGVNRDFAIAFMLAWYRCSRSGDVGQTNPLDDECLLRHFDNDRESLAEAIARVINTVRDNATRYEDRFVFRNMNVDVHDMVSVRDNMVRAWLGYFRSLSPVTKEELLR